MRNGTTILTTVRYGTVRYGTVRYGTVRYRITALFREELNISFGMDNRRDQTG